MGSHCLCDQTHAPWASSLKSAFPFMAAIWSRVRFFALGLSPQYDCHLFPHGVEAAYKDTDNIKVVAVEVYINIA